ncbi:transcription initiation factor TFIID subunit D1 [Galdieria sulphuraria]|uniref:Transcription initiation factor TFIID subunit D1 n=1 Tax=Galdieria sulphuraria TaxID=130081 RepID=M2W4L3_GALSU|nr:transcription initiation factor TFIID subunit D1 [Galdieria sulphuraria]EME30686.1 transcription initiation factor TFIID subunit D1 [Galdieria sulphuraria]|eukprot:XP_005707206.1 transcription initiation factor TFIID subunit D1 [Galdieria sulphuraria]
MDDNQVISKNELQRLADDTQLEEEVVEFLQEHAETFVESVTDFACTLAKHRNSNKLESCDIQLALEQLWGMRVPCIGQTVPTLRKPSILPAHTYRMQVIDSEQNLKGERRSSSGGRVSGKIKKADPKANKPNKKGEIKACKKEANSEQVT